MSSLDYYKDIHYEPDTEIEFGKYQGMTIKDIAEDDPSYVIWMMDQGFDMADEIDELVY